MHTAVDIQTYGAAWMPCQWTRMSLVRVVVIDSCLCRSDGWRVQEKHVDVHASFAQNKTI